MSKIFEVLSKDNLLNVDEMSSDFVAVQQPPPSAAGSENNSVDAGDTDLHASEPSAYGNHAVPLQVSALSPVFPFFEEEHTAAAEQYRIIRTKILHSAKRPRLIVISSPSSGDGKTITSINIAASLSLKEDMSVLLVDADLRRPMLAELLGIPNAPGIAEVLSGRISLSSAVIYLREFPNLAILPAGNAGQSAAELLHSERWPAIIENFQTKFNLVIMDATPVAVVADYELLQHVSDGVVLVVRPDHTNRKACITALQTVPRDKLIGVVLNCMKDWWLCKTYGYDYYRKESK